MKASRPRADNWYMDGMYVRGLASKTCRRKALYRPPEGVGYSIDGLLRLSINGASVEAPVMRVGGGKILRTSVNSYDNWYEKLA